MFHKKSTVLLVENDFILINRITQNFNNEYKIMVFFLIEIPLIEIKWISLLLNAFTKFHDLMHEIVTELS